MVFKDYVQDDIGKVFFNLDEFAEPYIINGCSVNIIIDNERSEKLANRGAIGIYGGVIVYYVKIQDFSKKPKIGDVQDFNDEYYEVVDVKEEFGIYEIILRGSDS